MRATSRKRTNEGLYQLLKSKHCLKNPVNRFPFCSCENEERRGLGAGSIFVVESI